MVLFVKRLRVFIPFGHLFIGGRKEKKITPDATTVSLHGNSFLWKPGQLKSDFGLIFGTLCCFPIQYGFISDIFQLL